MNGYSTNLILLYNTISHHSQISIRNSYDKQFFPGEVNPVLHVQSIYIKIKLMNKTLYKQQWFDEMLIIQDEFLILYPLSIYLMAHCYTNLYNTYVDPCHLIGGLLVTWYSIDGILHGRAFLVICAVHFWLYADCVPLSRARAYPCVYLTRRQSQCNREGLTPTLIYL